MVLREMEQQEAAAGSSCDTFVSQSSHSSSEPSASSDLRVSETVVYRVSHNAKNWTLIPSYGKRHDHEHVKAFELFFLPLATLLFIDYYIYHES